MAITKTGSITLTYDESDPRAAVIDTVNGYAYFGSLYFPGVITKIDLSTFTKVSYIDSGEYQLSTAVIDINNGYAYFGNMFTAPNSKIVKIDLATFTKVGTSLDTGETSIYSSVIDTNNGYAYFGTDDGKIIKLRLSDFSIVGTISTAGGTLMAAVIDTKHGYAYFGSYTTGNILKIRLSDFSLVGSLNALAGPLISAVIDRRNEFAYFGTWSEPGNIVKIKLSDFSRDAILPLTSGANEDYLWAAIIADKYAYFGTSNPSIFPPGKIVKIRLSDFQRVDTLTLASSEFNPESGVIDKINGNAYFGLFQEPGVIIKISDPDMMSTCPLFPKYSGNTVTLKATPRDGIGPYYVEFFKDGVTIPSSRIGGLDNPISNAPENVEITRVYTLDDADIASASLGTIDFSVYISDSCPIGPQFCTDNCIIDIGCVAPVCNFVVS